MEYVCAPWRGSGGGWIEEENKESTGQFIFRALFDPLTGEDKGGDGAGGVEK